MMQAATSVPAALSGTTMWRMKGSNTSMWMFKDQIFHATILLLDDASIKQIIASHGVCILFLNVIPRSLLRLG